MNQGNVSEERVALLYRHIHQLLEDGEARKAQSILQALFPVDRAEIFSDLPVDERQGLLQGLSAEEIADILEKVEDEEVAAIAATLPQA